MEPDPELIEKLVASIIEVANPLRIILFGSAASGTMGPESDLDVLVAMPEGTPCRETARRLYVEVKRLGRPVDYVVATPGILERHGDDIGFIYHEVLRHGRTVYAAP